MAERVYVRAGQGEDLSLEFSPRTPTDITGWTIEVRVTDADDRQNVHVLKTTGGGGVTVTDAAAGEFAAAIDSADHSGLLGGYWLEVARTDQGSRRLMARGPYVLEEVTAF